MSRVHSNSLNLRSFWQTTIIEIQRVIDHGWRRITGRPTRLRSMITPHLFLGGQYDKRGLPTLHRWGVTAVVSMRTKEIDQFLRDPNIKFLHLPTLDLHAPRLEDLKKGVEFITNEINSGGKVYIHCKHGEGRGPTMAVAYLLSTGMTLPDALTLIRKVRTFIMITQPQMMQLETFAELVKNSQY